MKNPFIELTKVDVNTKLFINVNHISVVKIMSGYVRLYINSASKDNFISVKESYNVVVKMINEKYD